MDEELTQEQLQAIEDAAFAAEMAGETIIADEPQAQEATPQEQEGEQEAVEAEAEQDPPRVEVIPGWTQEELAQLKEQAQLIPKLQRAIDTTNGTYGNKIAAIQKVIDSMSQPATKAEARKLSAENFKRLNSAFGSELAESLAEDLSEVITGGNPSIDLASYKNDLEKHVETRIAQAELKYAKQRLKDRHSDYEQVAAYSQDDNGMFRFADMNFGNWLAQQSADVQNVVINSNDPDEVSSVLDSYKQSANKAVTPNKQILQKAVQPKGIKSTSIGKSDKQLEEEAFLEEMRSGYA